MQLSSNAIVGETPDLAGKLPVLRLGTRQFVFVKLLCMDNAMGLECEQQDSISSLYSYESWA